MRLNPRIRKLLFAAVFLLPALAQAASEQVRTFLEGLDAGDDPVVAGERLLEPELLSRVYRATGHEPFWTAGGALEGEIANLLTAISQSVGHGFAPERYHRSAIERLVRSRHDVSGMALELLLTDAFIGQALHRGRGAVFPPNLDADWQVPQAEVDAGALLQETAARRENVITVLDRLWPASEEYARLVQHRAEIAASGDEIAVQIAAGSLLKPGQSHDRIIMLKQRLMGPGEHTPLYDEDLQREVKVFQLAAGLEPDGIVGNNTMEVLNATKVSWIDRIDANLERWRWLPREVPETYIRVNIAAFVLRVMVHDEPIITMNVIVGQPYRRTPVFTEDISYLVVNPYWNVPYTIATKDKLPLLKANALALAEKGYEAKPSGSDVFVSVDSIDWSGVTARNFNYLLRQRPGQYNALGSMKFMMPNSFAVYLHDTPSRELFARQERSFSSGCIRLEQPRVLADWLLSRESHPLAGQFGQILDSAETKAIHLSQPVPTYLVYFTAFSLDDGTVTFRRDIYGRDQMLIDALRAQQ